jgi:hypothetical protein
MLDEISSTPRKIGNETSFETRATCVADDLRIEVKGVGRIRLQVSAAQARKLCAAGKPAPFGWRDETRRDESVRKTWEIARSNVKIDLRSWNRTLESQLKKIRSRLGMPKEASLRAVFHKMLVYEPGHFFVSHQDLEKTEDLIVLFECAALIDAPASRDALIASLTQPQEGLDLLALAALLRKCRQEHTPAATSGLGLTGRYAHVVGQLESVLSRPSREPDDWSMAPPITCECALCAGLATFLRDPRRVDYSWPLAKERRRHVHQTIDRYALPVSHTTLRRGSPYTLVLKKLPALFERDAALRKEQTAELAWRVARRSDFAGSA